MQKKIPLLAILFSFSLLASAQNFAALQFDQFEKFVTSTENDTLYVINFWATWCGPCIEELPSFEKINAEAGNDKIKVILVSMDTESRWKNSLDPFIEKKQLQSEIWSLYNDKPVDWIDRIDAAWSGAIPGTLFLHKGTKTFYEKQFTYEELHTIIQQLKS